MLINAAKIGVYACSPLDEPGATYSTARIWLLRVGYYKLTREKEVAEDWVWIVDHTVQRGEEKAMLIVGLRLSCLPAVGQPLRHEDVEPITLEPVKESTGEDRKSTRLNSSHVKRSRMPSSA